MDELGPLLDEHQCTNGQCSRRTHSQLVLIAPADVATTADEVHTLRSVRESLAARHLRMLETVPMPRFETPDAAPVAWAVRYDDDIVAARPGVVVPVEPLRLSSFWPFRKRR